MPTGVSAVKEHCRVGWLRGEEEPLGKINGALTWCSFRRWHINKWFVKMKGLGYQRLDVHKYTQRIKKQGLALLFEIKSSCALKRNPGENNGTEKNLGDIYLCTQASLVCHLL